MARGTSPPTSVVLIPQSPGRDVDYEKQYNGNHNLSRESFLHSLNHQPEEVAPGS